MTFRYENPANSMAQPPQGPVSHWAILIGINYYVGDRCLRGAVYDVTQVKEYLQKQPGPVDVVILTATTPSNPTSGRPTEAEEVWPTYKNVVDALRRVISKAQRGHRVYIHYSGYGTRNEKYDSSSINDGVSQFALVLFGKNSGSNLYGTFLASAVKRMVDKGVRVTLVLDCCFSGSVPRGPVFEDTAELRSTDYRSEFDVNEEEEILEDCGDDMDEDMRKAIFSPNSWLLDPKGYTILAACGPHERAWELIVNGIYRGALSYFLLEALKTSGEKQVIPSHRSLYDHLQSLFQVHWPRQTPMRYGSKSWSLFGIKGEDSDTNVTSVPVLKNNKGLFLNAGQAQGVQIGDEYAVYPGDFIRATASDTPTVKVRVSEVDNLESKFVLVEQGTRIVSIETGWVAKLIRPAISQKISIGTTSSVLRDFSWRDSSLESSLFRLLIDNKSANETCMFHLTMNDRQEYVVLDSSHRAINTLPAIPCNLDGAENALLEMLRHISAFKLFEGINRISNPDFERSFSLVVTPPPENGIHLNLVDGDNWILTIENHGDKPLYVSIFNLRASWEVASVLSDGGQGDFLVVTPQSKEELEFEVEVCGSATKRGGNCCEDVIKIFITSRAVSFSSRLLEEMPLTAGELLDLTGAGRAVGEISKEDIWKLIDVDTRGDNDIRSQNWICKNVIVCTTARKESVEARD
ncbi:hypothetical protein DL769_002161 [Monosporascus sp. CRB-8-3]|nr:hypothetical protein DL769_002161 [Monosporascus sp. CRB-8-3]